MRTLPALRAVEADLVLDPREEEPCAKWGSLSGVPLLEGPWPQSFCLQGPGECGCQNARCFTGIH